jgi:hypothetical protein
VAFSSGAFAQYVVLNSKSPGYGTDVAYSSAYDQHTVVRFKAKVKGLSTTPGRIAGEATDKALMVRPFTMVTGKDGKKRFLYDTDLVPVELGPEWFVNDQSTKIKLNDYVEITGSRMVMGGTRVIIAQMVRKGVNVLAVRRMSGEPFWYPTPPTPTAAQVAEAYNKAGEEAAAQNLANWGRQPEGQHVWWVNNTQVYGDAYPITGATYYNVSGYVPIRQTGNSVQIQGYWYGGPPIIVNP